MVAALRRLELALNPCRSARKTTLPSGTIHGKGDTSSNVPVPPLVGDWWNPNLTLLAGTVFRDAHLAVHVLCNHSEAEVMLQTQIVLLPKGDSGLVPTHAGKVVPSVRTASRRFGLRGS